MYSPSFGSDERLFFRFSNALMNPRFFSLGLSGSRYDLVPFLEVYKTGELSGGVPLDEEVVIIEFPNGSCCIYVSVIASKNKGQERTNAPDQKPKER